MVFAKSHSGLCRYTKYQHGCGIFSAQAVPLFTRLHHSSADIHYNSTTSHVMLLKYSTVS